MTVITLMWVGVCGCVRVLREWVSGKGEDGTVTVGITYCHACYELEACVIVGGFPMVRVSVFKEGGRSILFYFTVCQHGASRDTRRAG